jgi:hypothetical protein
MRLMSCGGVQAEAIESEWREGCADNLLRLSLLHAATARAGHPLRSFAWGNRASLLDAPAAAGALRMLSLWCGHWCKRAAVQEAAAWCRYAGLSSCASSSTQGAARRCAPGNAKVSGLCFNGLMCSPCICHTLRAPTVHDLDSIQKCEVPQASKCIRR